MNIIYEKSSLYQNLNTLNDDNELELQNEFDKLLNEHGFEKYDVIHILLMLCCQLETLPMDIVK